MRHHSGILSFECEKFVILNVFLNSSTMQLLLISWWHTLSWDGRWYAETISAAVETLCTFEVEHIMKCYDCTRWHTSSWGICHEDTITTAVGWDLAQLLKMEHIVQCNVQFYGFIVVLIGSEIVYV